MKNTLQLLIYFALFSMHGQVGINTTTPNAVLEVKATNEAAPSATDGLIVLRLDTFPAVNPTANQQGMVIYLKNAAGTNQPGFYYWDNPSSSWLGLTGKADADWYETGSTNPPDAITDNVYRTGRVGIGINNPLYKLHVVGDPTDVAVARIQTEGSGTSLKIGVATQLSGTGNGLQIGTNNTITNSGTGERLGVLNEFLGSGNGTAIGVANTLSGSGGRPHGHPQ